MVNETNPFLRAGDLKETLDTFCPDALIGAVIVPETPGVIFLYAVMPGVPATLLHKFRASGLKIEIEDVSLEEDKSNAE